ncbi:MAG: recombinase family protein [Candidatus Eisenbacteria bacterium]
MRTKASPLIRPSARTRLRARSGHRGLSPEPDERGCDMRLLDIVNGTTGAAADENTAPERYLAYARVSTDEQERAGLSMPAQIREIEEYARRKGIAIAEVFQETGSAFSDESKRPEFRRMVERANGDPQITGILVHDFSRFFRDPYAGPMVKGELLSHGVRVVSATEPEYDPRTTAGLAIEKMTEFKNASYSLDVAFHTRKGMRENLSRRDPEIGFCYKNGGAAPWGFTSYRVERGVDRRGGPVMKTLWDKDETVVAGTCVWGWAQHVLVDLRLGEHASLSRIQKFLNEQRVPSPRKRYWSKSSLYSLLQPSALLQYAGYGVWNVHSARGRRKPPSEWEIVENAHPAIITMDEAEAIMEINKRQSRVAQDRSKGRMAKVRTKGSRYLLSGGLFVCKRCDANMVGYRNQNRLYYVCGSKAYRQGLGCGEGLQIRKDDIEDAVVEEIGHLFRSWTDGERLKRLMEEELKAVDQQRSEGAIEIERELARVEQETENLRSAIKAGLQDIAWANDELARLKICRDELLERRGRMEAHSQPTRIDPDLVEHCRQAFGDVFDVGTREEKRQFVRLFVKEIDLNPDTGDILMHLFGRPPLPASKQTPASGETGVCIGVVAGARFVADSEQSSGRRREPGAASPAPAPGGSCSSIAAPGAGVLDCPPGRH